MREAYAVPPPDYKPEREDSAERHSPRWAWPVLTICEKNSLGSPQKLHLMTGGSNIDALHRRWVTLLRALSEQQFERTFVHPELGSVALFEVLAMYAWHGRHHAAHIRNAISR